MEKTSLLSHEPWRLYAGLALVILGGVVMFAAKLSIVGSEEIALLYVGCGIVSTGFLWLLLMPKCPRCNLRLFPHAISTQPASGWLNWLLRNAICPRCGFSHEP